VDSGIHGETEEMASKVAENSMASDALTAAGPALRVAIWLSTDADPPIPVSYYVRTSRTTNMQFSSTPRSIHLFQGQPTVTRGLALNDAKHLLPYKTPADPSFRLDTFRLRYEISYVAGAAKTRDTAD
jgi:hypothetical protein